MATNANASFINGAKQYARQTVNKAWPSTRKVAVPSVGMHELDAICTIDEHNSIGRRIESAPKVHSYMSDSTL